MNGWGALFLLASVVAVVSLPLVLCAIIMRLVGRIGTRALAFVLAADAIPWGMAVIFWLSRGG